MEIRLRLLDLLQVAEAQGDGWQLPFPFTPDSLGLDEADMEWIEPRLVPQPIKTMFEPVHLTNPSAAALPRTYIYCSKLSLGFFEQSARHAQEHGWRYRKMDATHAAPVTEPQRGCN